MRLELEDGDYVKLVRERPVKIGDAFARSGYALVVCEPDGSQWKGGHRVYSRQEYQVDQAMRRGIPLSLMLGRVLDAD